MGSNTSDTGGEARPDRRARSERWTRSEAGGTSEGDGGRGFSVEDRRGSESHGVSARKHDGARAPQGSTPTQSDARASRWQRESSRGDAEYGRGPRGGRGDRSYDRGGSGAQNGPSRDRRGFGARGGAGQSPSYDRPGARRYSDADRQGLGTREGDRFEKQGFEERRERGEASRGRFDRPEGGSRHERDRRPYRGSGEEGREGRGRNDARDGRRGFARSDREGVRGYRSSERDDRRQVADRRTSPRGFDRRDRRDDWERDGVNDVRRDHAGVARGPRSWDSRSSGERDRPIRVAEPPLPDEITGKELDRGVWQQLRTLSKENAEGVARHLVAAAELLDLDPELALQHAQHVVTRAGRVPAAREALGLVLYRQGAYAEALREFRTARRLSGSDHLLPYMVDCERGLGRFERALELANSPEAQRLPESDNIELAIVVSGVRRDMGQARAAVVGLRIPALRKATTQPWAARLFYAYADALMDIDEVEEAREWFSKAAAADSEGETDADERLALIDGVVLDDLAPEEGDVLDPRFASIDLKHPFGVAPTDGDSLGSEASDTSAE